MPTRAIRATAEQAASFMMILKQDICISYTPRAFPVIFVFIAAVIEGQGSIRPVFCLKISENSVVKVTYDINTVHHYCT